MAGLLETTNYNDLGPEIPNDPVKPKLQEYQKYFLATVEHFIGRDLQPEEILFEDDITERLKIKEWNIQEVSKPTKQQVITYWDNNKADILKRLALKLHDKKAYFIFMNQLFENYKNTDTDYLTKKSQIENATIQQLKDYINGL